MGLIRLGIVSTAHINRLVIPGAQASDKVELIAVASREQSRAEEYARTWGIERAYGSYEALLEDSEVDAVYISLPNTMHCEWSIRALEAGKHVLCEKPFSRHPDEVEGAFDAAERSGRLLTEAFMYRHNPQTKRLEELVRERRDRRAPGRTFRFQLLPLRRGQHPPAHRRRGRQPDGRRLLLRERIAAHRGRARERVRAGVRGAERNRLGLHGHDAVSRTTSSRSSTAERLSRSATSSRRSGPRARCSSTTRGTAGIRSSSCAATLGSSTSSSTPSTRTDSSSRT